MINPQIPKRQLLEGDRVYLLVRMEGLSSRLGTVTYLQESKGGCLVLLDNDESSLGWAFEELARAPAQGQEWENGQGTVRVSRVGPGNCPSVRFETPAGKRAELPIVEFLVEYRPCRKSVWDRLTGLEP